MPRFAANLSMMFTEVPFLDRFEMAARSGFTAVEFLFPYEHPAEQVGERLKRNGNTTDGLAWFKPYAGVKP
jgi:hydroxypyruvate isomerase